MKCEPAKSFRPAAGRACRILLGVGCLVWWVSQVGPVVAQERFRADASALRLEIVPRAADGTVIAGLTADDIEVRIEGELRPVVSLQELRPGAPHGGVAPAGSGTLRPAVEPRTFLLLFDLSTGAPGPIELARAIRSARVALRAMQAADRIAMATCCGGDGRLVWNVPFASDPAVVEGHLGKLESTRLLSAEQQSGRGGAPFLISPLLKVWAAVADREGATEVLYFGLGASVLGVPFAAAGLRGAGATLHAMALGTVAPPPVNRARRATGRHRAPQAGPPAGGRSVSENGRRSRPSWNDPRSDPTPAGSEPWWLLHEYLGDALEPLRSLRVAAEDTGGSLVFTVRRPDEQIERIVRAAGHRYIAYVDLDGAVSAGTEIEVLVPGDDTRVFWRPWRVPE